MAEVEFEVVPEWVHVRHSEKSGIREVYGLSNSGGFINLEGLRYLPGNRPSKTLLMFMHPASTMSMLPIPRALARRGLHVLCAGSRYARNDTPLIMEKVLLDFGAYVRHAREVWGYEKVVIVGWSGGGSLSAFYQAQAERRTVTQTPAGDPIDLDGLIPGDAFIWQAAHLSRANVLADSIDPSVLDENNPALRDPELDIYDPRNPHQPPYDQAYLDRFRDAQVARIRRRTALVKQMLEDVRSGNTGEVERGLLTHLTMADPRWLDSTMDPNDRRIGWMVLGDPKESNSSPAGIARFSTLRAWLSQWSIDDTQAKALDNAPSITVPLLAIENTADDAVPQPDTRRFLDAAGSTDKQLAVLQGANHYYIGQPDKMKEVLDLTIDWLRERGLEDV